MKARRPVVKIPGLTTGLEWAEFPPMIAVGADPGKTSGAVVAVFLSGREPPRLMYFGAYREMDRRAESSWRASDSRGWDTEHTGLFPTLQGVVVRAAAALPKDVAPAVVVVEGLYQRGVGVIIPLAEAAGALMAFAYLAWPHRHVVNIRVEATVWRKLVGLPLDDAALAEKRAAEEARGRFVMDGRLRYAYEALTVKEQGAVAEAAWMAVVGAHVTVGHPAFRGVQARSGVAITSRIAKKQQKKPKER